MNQRLFVCEYVSGGGLDGSATASAELPTAAQDALRSQGLAMRDALLADLARVPGLTLRCAQGPQVSVPAGAEVASPRAGEAFDAFVCREAAAHDLAWIVAPETGGLLASLARAVEPVRWIGCEPAAIALCTSKRATLERLASHGLATPLAWRPLRAASRTGRWVVKPDDGAGSVETRVHARLEDAQADLAERIARGAPAALEPWIEGDALSLSLLCRGDGRAELLSINRQRIEVAGDGQVHYLGVAPARLDRRYTRAGALATTARAVMRAIPGLRGFVGVDLLWHAERGPVLIEVNPRLTCAYVSLSAALGRNLAGEIVAQHGSAHAGAGRAAA